MCTILDAAEERGVNRGETLKLIMMVQKKIKKGDSIAKIADDLVEDEIVISPIYENASAVLWTSPGMVVPQ